MGTGNRNSTSPKGKGKTKKDNSQVGASDLLAPILFVVCIMPFIMRLAVYELGYDAYNWAADHLTTQNFFSYYRSRIFIWVMIGALMILVIKMLCFRKSNKEVLVFWPLVGYLVLTLLSTVFSMNVVASLFGNNDILESVFVLFGYVLVGFYTYQVVSIPKDYKVLQIAFWVLAVGMIIVGMPQFLGYEWLTKEWFQKLIMNAEQEALFLGQYESNFSRNNVYLTLYNPNYAGQFLAMLVTFFSVMFFLQLRTLYLRNKQYVTPSQIFKNVWKTASGAEKSGLIMNGVCTILLLVLLFSTYSRGAILALSAGLGFFCIFMLTTFTIPKKVILSGVGVLAGLLVLFVVVDAFNGFYFMHRFLYADISVEEKVIEMESCQDGVLVTFSDKTTQFLTPEEGEESFTYTIPGTRNTWTFYYDESVDLWCLLNGMGKLDALVPIEMVEFGGMKHLGSGRLYIWSRVIPKLKNYLIIGSGPDTFPEVFPQNDYLGKIYFGGKTTRVIESAHNIYLNYWVQTGLAGLICLLVTWFWGIKRAAGRLRLQCRATLAMDAGKKQSGSIASGREAEEANNSLKLPMGIASLCSCIAFLVGGIVNTSTLYTTPVFWVFFGIMMASITGARSSERR